MTTKYCSTIRERYAAGEALPMIIRKTDHSPI